jgi:hypothetical protein
VQNGLILLKGMADNIMLGPGSMLIVFFPLFRHSGGQKQAEVPDLRPGAGGGRGESERAGLRPFPVPPRRATENIVGKVTKERIFFWFYLPTVHLQIF